LEVLTFSGCGDLCRASRLADVLYCCARIFQNSAGSALTYELSKQVTGINTFISHNWSVSRFYKFATLTFRFNCGTAALVTLAEMSMFGLANALGLLPHVSTESSAYPNGICCRLFCAPTFLLVAVFAQDIRRLVGFAGPLVFLDKTCIHQVDPEIQRRGINQLGGFMCNYDEMLVVYSDVYLLRLWTVYEVAAFLSLHSVDKMTVISVVVPMLLYSGLALLWLSNVVGVLTEFVGGPDLIASFLLPILGCLALAFGLRVRQRDKVMIRSRLSEFSVRNCICYAEADRPVVYANIVALMKETTDDLCDADEEVALQHFDALVRGELAHALISSMGRFSLPYRYVLYFVGFTRGASALDLLAGFPFGLSWREVLIKEIYWVLFIFGAYPLAFASGEFLSGRFIDFRGCKEVAWIVCIGFLETLWAVPVFGACRVLEDRSRTSGAALVAFALFCSSTCGLAFLVYSPYVNWARLAHRCRRRSRSS